ncbi:MAG TPA: four helix bundle protein [Planctomycetota bacterium]|nr:four helix bundle protein [Planctomycetota bacterium]
MQDFRTLRVWHLSQELGDHVELALAGFPPEGTTGQKCQLRDACASIESNIAEGCGRDTRKEMTHFLHIALGSTNEVDCRLERARRSGFITSEMHDDLYRRIVDVRKMLTSLIVRVRSARK